MDWRKGNWDIYGYSLSTATEFSICTDASYQGFPAICGHIVVWQDNRNGNSDIYGYNLETNKEFVVCKDPAGQFNSAVSGNFIVWDDYRNANADIYGYNLSSSTEFDICTDKADQKYPEISGLIVVWMDERNANWDIYGYDLGLGGGERVFENHQADQQFPDVDGDKVVWADYRNGNWDIYGGDMRIQEIFPICTDSAYQTRPAVSCNHVVWQDLRNQEWDIYGGVMGATCWEKCGTTLDFEYVFEYAAPEWMDITDHFQGVTFSAPDAFFGGTCDGEVIIRNMTAYNGTSSGVQALGTKAGPACEFSPEYLRMVFDEPQKEVSFTVGPYCGTYVINAYDSGGSLVSSQSVVIADCTALHGVYRPVVVSTDTKVIRRIEIDDGMGASEHIDDLVFGADDTPPIARIDFPGWSDCACQPVEVLGVACDEDSDIEYLLEYRGITDTIGPWNPIHGSTEQLCDGGLLALWDISPVPHGYYYLRLTVTNECELTATATSIAYVDKVFNILTVTRPQNGHVVRGDSVCIAGTVWDNWCFDSYTVKYRPTGTGPWNPVDPANPVYTTIVWNDPYAWWDTTALPDGGYEILVEAVDECGNTKTELRQVTVDNTAPTAEITAPAECTYVPHNLVPIYGTANDNIGLQSWYLEYTGDGVHGWANIASGNTPIISGLLGTWDTTSLPPCAYTLRLRVYDWARLNCDSPTHFGRKDYIVSVNVGINVDFNNDGCINFIDFAEFANRWLTGVCPPP